MSDLDPYATLDPSSGLAFTSEGLPTCTPQPAAYIAKGETFCCVGDSIPEALTAAVEAVGARD
ncbi:MAG: hypothetical protein HRU14_17440 [Planctomycetes bacterium]|nr:hypothetical protein [Planctomycetota bacterium]